MADKGDDRDIWKGLNKKDDNYVGKLRGYKDEYTLYGSELHRQSYAAVCFGKSKRFVSKKNAKPRSVRAFLPILNEKGRVSRSMISSKPMVDTLKEKIKMERKTLKANQVITCYWATSYHNFEAVLTV